MNIATTPTQRRHDRITQLRVTIFRLRDQSGHRVNFREEHYEAVGKSTERISMRPLDETGKIIPWGSARRIAASDLGKIELRMISTASCELWSEVWFRDEDQEKVLRELRQAIDAKILAMVAEVNSIREAWINRKSQIKSA